MKYLVLADTSKSTVPCFQRLWDLLLELWTSLLYISRLASSIASIASALCLWTPALQFPFRRVSFLNIYVIYMSDDMAKGKKTSKGQRRDDVERKRDERCRRNALRKERKNKDDLELDENFTSFSNQLEAQGLKIRYIIGDGWVSPKRELIT